MPLTFDDAVTHLRTRLARPLPGTEAQLRLAPTIRQDPSMARVAGKPCREAAVLVLLLPHEAEAAVVLTVRHADLRHHAGQISFPGGRREPGEELRETALREAHEEIGLSPGVVEVVGMLTPLYIPPSNFCVYPYVGAVPHAPALAPHDAEVAAILRVPLSHLMHPATLSREPRMLRGREVEVPYFSFDSYKVWGATAMMLAELMAIFETRDVP